MTTSSAICIAFVGHRRIAHGPLTEVAAAARAELDINPEADVLVLDDQTSEQVEVDFRGTVADVVERLDALVAAGESCSAAIPASVDAPEPDGSSAPRTPGRPRLGVVAREVTLLPRHWDWLATQPGGASAALRRLVEAARRASSEDDRRRLALEATYRFAHTACGDLPGYEEALRALYAGDAAAFRDHTGLWPADLRDHARSLASRAFAQAETGVPEQE